MSDLQEAPPSYHALLREPPKQPPPLFELTPEAIEAATVEERDAIISDLQKWGMLHLPYPAIVIRFPQEAVAKVLGWERHPEADDIWISMLFKEIEPLTIEPVYTSQRLQDVRGPFTREQLDHQVARGETNKRMCVECSVSTQMYVEDLTIGAKWMDLNNPAHDPAPDKPGSFGQDYAGLGLEAVTILLASLAARNVVKDTRTNTGGSAPRYIEPHSGVTYLSRTIIRPPRASEMESDPDHPPRGDHKPHLRRGHEHTVVADTTGAAPEGTRTVVVGKGRAGRRVQWFAPTYVNVDRGFVAAPHYVVRS